MPEIRPFMPLDTEERLFDELEARSAPFQANLQRANALDSVNASQMTQRWPDMEPGVVESLINAGIDPGSPEAKRIAEVSAAKAADEGRDSNPADDVPDSLFDQFAGALGDVVKPAVRGAFLALETPFREASRLASSVGEAALEREGGATFWEDFVDNYTKKAAPSQMSLAVAEAFREGGPGDLDFGSGFFPRFTTENGQTTEDMKKRLTLLEQKDGRTVEQFVTPGRTIAHAIGVEPGSRPYDFISGGADFAFNIAGDPLIWAGGAASKIVQARKGFKQVGLLNGLVKTAPAEEVIPRFLKSSAGNDLKKWIAETDDHFQIWEKLNKPDGHVVRGLAEKVKTPQQADEALQGYLGGKIETDPTAGMFGRAIGRTLGNSQLSRTFGPGAAIREKFAHKLDEGWVPNLRRGLFHDIPGFYVDARDPKGAMQAAVDYARNAKLPDSLMGKHVSNFAKVQKGDTHALLEATEQLMYDVASHVTKHQLSDDILENIPENVFDDAMGRFVAGESQAGREILRAHGLEADQLNEVSKISREARKMTKIFDEVYEEGQKYFIDREGHPVFTLGNDVIDMGDGKFELAPEKHLWSEAVGNTIAFPDFRKVRRATGNKGVRWLMDTKLGQGSEAFLDWAMQEVWKPLVLLRGAWTMRVIAEEQARMAGAGLDSFINHPMSAIGWAIGGGQSKTRKLLEKIPGMQAKGTKALNDEVFQEMFEHGTAMSRRISASGDVVTETGLRSIPGEFFTGHFTKAHRGHEEYFRGWATEIHQLNADPIAARVARGLSDSDMNSIAQAGIDISNVNPNSTEAVKLWATHGSGRKFINDLAQDSNKRALIDSNVARRQGRELADHPGIENVKQAWDNNQDAIDWYVDTVAHRVHIKTGGSARWADDGSLVIEQGGHDDLLEAIGKGELQGAKFASKGRQGNKELQQVLEEAYQDVGPQTVKVEISGGKAFGGTSMDRVHEVLDPAVETMFNALMGAPTDNLSRSVAFRQFYWKRIDDLVARADDTTQRKILQQAEAANIDKKLFKSIKSKVGTTQATEFQLAFDDINQLAKGHALDNTRDLLYDLTKRSQWADVARNLIPFGEAWKEIMVSWGKIFKKRPHVIRRFQQGMEGAEGSGIFHRRNPDDPSSEMMFTFPGVGKLASPFITKGSEEARIEFQAPVKSLNLVGHVLPGFGPAVTIPVNKLVPDKPGTVGRLKDFVDPFGDSGDPALSSFAPSWAKKAWKAMTGNPDSDRLYANTVFDVAKALSRSGEYNTNSREGVRKLINDSKRKAGQLYMIRSLVQFAGPTGPQVEFQTKDAEGNWVAYHSLAKEYAKIRDEYGDEQAAFDEFIRRFGVENLIGLQGKTRQLRFQGPPHRVTDDWIKSHPEQKEKYPNIIGFYAPEGDPDDFDYNVYVNQLREGVREQLEPEQMVKLHNRFVANVQYNQARRIAERRGGPEADNFISMVREQLKEQYPGFREEIAGVAEAPDTEQRIAELQRSLEDETLRSTHTGRALSEYFKYRQMANAEAEQFTDAKSFKTAKSAEYIRDWLRGKAQQLIKKHGQPFSRVWHGLLKREMKEDVTEEEVLP